MYTSALRPALLERGLQAQAARYPGQLQGWGGDSLCPGADPEPREHPGLLLPPEPPASLLCLPGAQGDACGRVGAPRGDGVSRTCRKCRVWQTQMRQFLPRGGGRSGPREAAQPLPGEMPWNEPFDQTVLSLSLNFTVCKLSG